jgi:hypothetical protein
VSLQFTSTQTNTVTVTNALANNIHTRSRARKGGNIG